METLASIIAVVQISEEIIKYISKVHGAADERTQLRQQVRHSSNTLLLLRDGCEDSEQGQAWAETIKLLDAPLSRLQKALELAAAKLQSRSSIKEKLKWPFKKEEVQKLVDVIKSEEGLLVIALQNNSARLQQEINLRLKRCESHLVELEVLMRSQIATIEVHSTGLMVALATFQDDQKTLRDDQKDVKKLIEQRTDAEVQNDEAAKKLATLNWLSLVDHLTQQDQHIHKRQAGTCTWFLESKTYQDWSTSRSKSTLFCPGMPGAGKTVLSSVVIADLKARYGPSCDVAVTYVFCGFKLQDEQIADSILLSILKQLLEHRTSLPDSIRLSHTIGTRPQRLEIPGLLGTEISSYSRVFIVIDALDECEESEELLSDLYALQTESRIHLLVTSRYITSIVNLFQGACWIEVRASDEDVHKYIEARMHRKPKFLGFSQRMRDDIQEAIVHSVQGMFLLAKLHFDSLERKTSVRAMNIALKGLGTGSNAYDSAYDSAMERINSQVDDQVALAKEVLSWIVHAKRQITTNELQQALGIEIGESEFDRDSCPTIDDMISVCAGLVTVDEGINTIRLVHYTTQEYFERRRHDWFPNAEWKIAALCTTYLSLNICGPGCGCSSPSYWSYRSHHPEYVFFDYAAQHWGEHARLASPVPSYVESFLRNSENVAMVADILYSLDTTGVYDNLLGRPASSLHMAAFFGLDSVAVAIINETSEPDLCTPEGTTPLMFAALRGHESVVRALLQNDAAVDKINESGYTSLFLAAEKGHAGVVKTLLENHANLGIGHTSQDPLRCAVQFGHEATVRLLLEAWAELESQREEGVALLNIACVGGHAAIVELLLNAGVDIHDQPEGVSGSLHRACEFGHLPIVKFLVDAGVNLDHPGYDGASPLINACIEGNQAIVDFLLTRGAEVECQDDNGDSPLHHGCQVKTATLVQLLLERGAKINCRNKDGQRSLHVACRHGHEATVRVLLEAGSDINSKDNRGRTPLHEACYAKNVAIIRVLLDRGADTKLKNKEGQTPLHIACGHAHEASVRLLLPAHPDINCKNKKGRTPLHEACYAKNVAVIRLLLEAEAEVFHEDNNGFTPIMISRKAPRHAVMEVLLLKHVAFDHTLSFRRQTTLVGLT